MDSKKRKSCNLSMKGDTEETLDKVSDSETAPFKAAAELHAKFNDLDSLHIL